MTPDNDRTVHVPDPMQPRSMLGEVLFGWLRYLPPWDPIKAVQIAWFGLTFSILGGCVLFTFGFLFAVLAGLIEVRWPGGSPVDLTDSQYERLSDETAEKIIRKGGRAP